MVNFSNSECVDTVLLYGVCEHLHQWYSISEIWYIQPQTHDRGRDRTERILQVEKHILESDEEEPDISIPINNTPCLSAVGNSNLKLNCLFMFIHRKNVT